MQLMSIRDTKTKQKFEVDPTANTVRVKTRDGVEIKIHPVTIRMMVPKGQKFDGQTLTGTREMERV